MGQDDKLWSALVTPLAGRTEKWWGAVMDVGLDPELTKWSVRLGPATVLTEKGYKEHHWLVIPPINRSGYLLFHTSITLFLPCRCPLVPFQELRMSSVGDVPLYVSGVKPGTEPTPGEP